jgi:hypothetical protein
LSSAPAIAPEGDLSAAISSAPQPGIEAPQSLLAWLANLARAVVFPFDKVLTNLVCAGLCVDALCQFLGLTRAILDEHIVRLGLRTPNDKPFRRPSVSGWSIEDTQKLMAWRTVGVHPEVIGQSLSRQRSANAVRAKARRLGLETPARASLFRPDPCQLSAPKLGLGVTDSPSSPETSCGRAAGPIAIRLVEVSEPARFPAKRSDGRHRESNPEGQRELALFGIVGGTDRAPGIVLDAPPVKTPDIDPVEIVEWAPPATEEDVDFSDLSWVGRLKDRRDSTVAGWGSPLLSNKVAVWVIGMLMMSGVHYQDAARMTGLTPASFRTLRTRCRAPVDYNRKNIRHEFDEEIARTTVEKFGLIVRKSLRVAGQEGPPEYFWVQKDDRRTHLSPIRRVREPGERQSPLKISIVARAEMDIGSREVVAPFAKSLDRLTRDEPRQVRPCATSKPPSRDGSLIPTSKPRLSAVASA